jgi:uncharacterized membrane protein
LAVPSANLAPPRSPELAIHRAVFLLVLLAMLAQIAWYYPRLPDPMPSHFDVAGAVNATMPKAGFLQIHLFVTGLLTLIFFVLPALVVRLPPGMINLPNKDYWLAPERRLQTARTIQVHLVGFGNATMLFLLLVFRAALRASLMPVPRLSRSIWVALLLLGIFVVWTVRLLRAFRLPR